MMKINGVHIFIILILALMCSSCLGGFMREGYENDDGAMNADPEDNSKNKNQHFSSYDDMYKNLDEETVDYSNTQLAKNKKIGPHKSKDNYDNANDDANDDNNINSYGNVNKYPNVENDNMLMAGKGKNNKKLGERGGRRRENGTGLPAGARLLPKNHAHRSRKRTGPIGKKSAPGRPHPVFPGEKDRRRG